MIGRLMNVVLGLVAGACCIAGVVWGRSAYRLYGFWNRVRDEQGATTDSSLLARSSLRRELHTTLVYATVALALGAVAIGGTAANAMFALLIIPVGLSLYFSRSFGREARLAEDRSVIERKAEEVLTQEELAPKRWAARLAPEDLPDFAGFEIGRVYQAGTGMMAGDFYDVFSIGPNRVAAVIGDVSGRGIEPSITAFQAKYLLRVFLHQYRDPAQGLEQLNTQMSATERGEELISLLVAVFDTDASTLRFASAGHPPAWFWHDKVVRPLRGTGPLVMLDPTGRYYSREIALARGDLLLLYTDGLSEIRNGEQIFGEERIANMVRRDPSAPADVLCKNVLEAARDFAAEPMTDDVAILGIRRT
jgi:serine phosphatase RsbU (regulator of sigma subunit)